MQLLQYLARTSGVSTCATIRYVRWSARTDSYFQSLSMAGNHGNCISGAWLYTVKLLLATSVMVSSSSGIRTQRSGLFTHDASHATALNPLEAREWRNGEYCNIWAVRLLISRLLIGGIVVPYIHLMYPICRTQCCKCASTLFIRPVATRQTWHAVQQLYH